MQQMSAIYCVKFGVVRLASVHFYIPNIRGCRIKFHFTLRLTKFNGSKVNFLEYFYNSARVPNKNK
jgi:hypothetical protein